MLSQEPGFTRPRFLVLRIGAVFVAILAGSLASGQQADTLPKLVDGNSPQNFLQMWAGFDARSEPLEL